jgi:DNA ligase (NAD+)
MPEVDIFADEMGGSTVTLGKKEKERVTYLVRVLDHLIGQHGLGLPTTDPDTLEAVSDKQFDKMKAELKKLDPAAVKKLGSASAPPLDPNAKKIKHDPPMVSIDKANGTLEERTAKFEKWVKLISKETGLTEAQVKDNLVDSFKHDGCAVSITYVNGKLTSAGLRPRHGIFGEDVTENVKYIPSIPQQLPLPLSCVIRGELECRISTFNKLNGSAAVEGQEFANPRNYTTGSVRQYKDPSKTKSRQISFTGYSILNLADSHKYYKTEIERAKWANQTLGVPFVRTEKWTPTCLAEMEAKVAELDYEVDGVVISFNSLEMQEQLGTYGGNVDGDPRGKLAWKFDDEVADPIVLKQIWETGRLGDITPVNHFAGVKLAGTTVVKASGHSFGYLVRNNIKAKTKVRIRKSGKIIPDTLGHYDEKGNYIEKMEAGDPKLPKEFDLTKFEYPKTCPSCGTPTEVRKGAQHGMLELVCPNKVDCPAQNIRWFLNYLDKFGVKGLGESTVTSLVEGGLIKRFCDFYTLKASQLLGIGFSKRESLLCIAQIHMVQEPEQVKDNIELAKITADAIGRKKRLSLSSFIACLGIPGAAKGTGTALALHFRDLASVLSATAVEMEKCPDVGSITSASVVAHFEKHSEDIKELAAKYIDVESPKSGRYTNKTFVFTGGQPEGKEYWKELVEQEGGIVKGSVSKKTDYVIIGNDAGEKADKARALVAEGHPVIIVDNHHSLLNMFK